MSEPKRQKMVGWYDPSQLLQTAGKVVVSTIFGRNADQRLIEALFADPSHEDPKDLFIDHSHYAEYWLDYVADLGEGWNSTYTVAYYTSLRQLQVACGDTQYHTIRGQTLVFGGDVVYPTASRLAYKNRTFYPYDCAFSDDGTARPDIIALPGNHDWYDNLVSFTRYFISKDNLAGFGTPQRRSYFAIKLPHGWWLLGADTQLDSYIDGPQVEYFRLIAKEIRDGDSVILCNSEPSWIYEAAYHDDDPNVDDRNLDYLEKEILAGKSVRVFLAGDLHHYRRHAAKNGTQKITAGGGGAFLHPTHGWNLDQITETLAPTDSGPAQTFDHKVSWPNPSVSRQLTFHNLLFPILNWKFGIAPAMLYLLTAWSVMVNVGKTADIREAVWLVFCNSLITPFSIMWSTVLLLGFLLFTDTHVRWYRWTAGTVHGILHLMMAFLIGWGATYFAVTTVGLEFKDPWQLLLSGLLIFVGGWVVGSMLLGIYLLVSLNVFGRHMNEAFSSLRIEDWKHFLRLHIDRTGLTIFPIGIRRVPRKWRKKPLGKRGPKFISADPHATAPVLIEQPIRVTHLHV